jgi:hypothetical protein
MKRTIVILGLLLGCSGVARGQACITYSDNYVGSWNMAMTSTPSGGNGSSFSVQFTVLVDGSATMTVNPSGCGIGGSPNLSGVTHMPQLSISVNGSPTYYNGPAVCHDCYINASMTPTYSEIIGTPVTLNPGADVDCSMGGIFFTWFPTYQFEGAFTFVKNEEPLDVPQSSCETPSLSIWVDGTKYPNQQVCYYTVSNWCTNTPDADYGTSPFSIALAVADVQGVSPATGGMKGWWLNFYIPIYRVLNSSGQPITGWFNPTQSLGGQIYIWWEVLETNAPYGNSLIFTMLSQPSTTYTYPKGVCTAATPSSAAFVATVNKTF